ncbi:MAG: hypothetical protein M3437_11575 [Chloroflexota bacterium]|nr:hypothetical protein [Chloroflexota bacterium]MDQ5865478.1 hypothetical protein [Chloroflexota bacterium]
MSSEIFQFVTIRPPQQQQSIDTGDDVVDLGLQTGELVDSLRKLRVSGTRSSITAVVRDFVASDGFINSPRKLDSNLKQFFLELQQFRDEDFREDAYEAFVRQFDTEPFEFVLTDEYTRPFAQVTDSIVAAMIDTAVAPAVRSFLVRAARVLWLIRWLADTGPIGRGAGARPVTRRAFLNAPLALPGGIFPLPVAGGDFKGERRERAETNRADLEASRRHLATLAADLAAYRNAADELLTAFQRINTQLADAQTPPDRRVRPARDDTPAGFLLPEATANGLSDATKAALKRVGVGTTNLDIVKSVALLEQQAASATKRLYNGVTGSRAMVRIGNRIIPRDAFLGGFTIFDPGSNSGSTPGNLPGICPPAPETVPPEESPTVPSGYGDARVLGIADLLVVEQDLLRYELGEIAHIENVLRSEVRSRKFKTTETVEQSLTTETETTTSKEQDLASSERFELQTESERIIQESASKAAGLTIHASYGPTVDATASYNATSSTATQQSNAAASNYAREVTTRAVSRVQTRTLTRRTVTRTNVVEETNRHAFDNTTGSADIIGVYRFIDKVYQAQIVNYGKRLMLEFIVPEPAAFLRYAFTNKPLEGVDLVEPDPPGYCLANGTSFVALQASDLTPENYMQWVSKYGAQDVTPPPPSLLTASGWKKAPDQMPLTGTARISSDILDVAIPEGYHCVSAFVNIYGETQAGTHKIVFQIQDQQGMYVEPFDDNHLYYLHLAPSPTLSVTINSLRFHNYEVLVTALCTLTPQKLQEWQLRTFASIMNAYNDLKSTYDQAVQEARLQATDLGVTGTNAENNRITEQVELKKGCISLLTGQRFDLFDAVARNVAPYGYPEIDFAEAKAEGAYIQMFEQSFEWNNMVYLFYPYFWGKKDDWVTVAQLTDNDPLFTRFLQAGAARVQVPVRPGFEEAIITYLSTGELWAGEGTLVNSDDGETEPLHLSVVDEIKSQSGNNNVEGVGTLTLVNGSAEVSGSGTEFTEYDQNRRIIIGGVTYIIKSFQDVDAITLATPYSGQSDSGVAYALGGKLVGQPWEIKLPTNLVKLDDSLVFS